MVLVGWACGVPVGHWGKGYLAMDAPRKIRGFLAGVFKETEIIRCVMIREGHRLLPRGRELCLEKGIASRLPCIPLASPIFLSFS